MADRAKMTGVALIAVGMLCYGAALALCCFAVMGVVAIGDAVRGSRTLQMLSRLPA